MIENNNIPLDKIESNKISSNQELKTEFLKQRTNITNKCRDEVNAVLEKYDCTFDVSVLINKNVFLPQINIVMKG